MKFYRFVVPIRDITVGQGKFRSEAQAKKVAQQITFSRASAIALSLPGLERFSGIGEFEVRGIPLFISYIGK